MHRMPPIWVDRPQGWGRRVGLALALVSTATCGAGPEHESFVPLERPHGQTLEGYTEAVYDLSGEDGRFGEAKVWSRGAYLDPEGQDTLLHVGLDFENGGPNTIFLNPARVRLESVQTSDQVLRDVPPIEPREISTIPPESTGRVELLFALARPIRPAEVQAFRVAWSVRSNGQRFSEFTPFARSEPATYYVPVRAYYYPYYPAYYPFYDPLWGPRRDVVIVPRHYPRRIIVRGRRIH